LLLDRYPWAQISFVAQQLPKAEFGISFCYMLRKLGQIGHSTPITQKTQTYLDFDRAHKTAAIKLVVVLSNVFTPTRKTLDF